MDRHLLRRRTLAAALVAAPMIWRNARAQSAPARMATPAQSEGPFYPVALPADSDHDLLRNGSWLYLVLNILMEMSTLTCSFPLEHIPVGADIMAAGIEIMYPGGAYHGLLTTDDTSLSSQQYSEVGGCYRIITSSKNIPGPEFHTRNRAAFRIK